VEHWINGEPSLVLRDGRFLHEEMKAQRITENEILSAVREEGLADLTQVDAVVLETNGSLSVIHFGQPGEWSTLRDVPGVCDDDTTDRGTDPQTFSRDRSQSAFRHRGHGGRRGRRNSATTGEET
jgi:hypothetical protein